MTETPEIPQVYTRRLLLRPFTEQDFPAFMGYHSLPETYATCLKCNLTHRPSGSASSAL